MCVVVVFLAVSVYTNTWHLCPHVTIIAGVLALPETNGPQDNKTTLFHLHFSSCSLFTAFPLFCFLFLIWHFILCLPPTWTSWPAFLSLSVNACYLHLIIPSVFLPSLWHFPPLNVNTLLKPQMCTGFIMLIFPILSMLIPLVSILGNQGKTVLLFSPACTSCCYLSWNTATSDVIILCVMFKCRVCFVSIFHSFFDILTIYMTSSELQMFAEKLQSKWTDILVWNRMLSWIISTVSSKQKNSTKEKQAMMSRSPLLDINCIESFVQCTPRTVYLIENLTQNSL